MDELPLWLLFGALALLILLSAFFSGSEIGLMTLNRYRLRHLAKAGKLGAAQAEKLLAQPDRLIGLILLGSNFVNALATGLATVIALRLFGDKGVAVATGAMTFLLLVFTDVAPKTLAALHPERIAFPSAYALTPLLWLFGPIVRAVTVFSNGLLHLLGVRVGDARTPTMSSEELRAVVIEAGAMIPRRHQKMLLSLLDLEKVTVEDIMIPRTEVSGIDLDAPWAEVEVAIGASQYTRLPVYQGEIEHILGFVHVRAILSLVRRGECTREALLAVLEEPYFIPENVPLNKQLLNFQRERRRIGLVVDEYGDILGLATLEDILEEIVGEFTTDPGAFSRDLHPQPDGSWLVDGGASVRILQRTLNWALPQDGPRTLNGLILEHLEAIPEPGTSLILAGRPVEIMQVKDNAVKTARVSAVPHRAAAVASG